MELTERERELCAWALRVRAKDPHFYNQRMKQEILGLADKLSPIDHLSVEASIPNPTTGGSDAQG